MGRPKADCADPGDRAVAGERHGGDLGSEEIQAEKLIAVFFPPAFHLKKYIIDVFHFFRRPSAAVVPRPSVCYASLFLAQRTS